MFLKNVVDEVFNHDFVMQSSIGSKTKHFHTIDHLRPLTWFCGDCQLWPNQQIRHMAQFWIQHQFRLEVYQIFFKKLIHHLQSIIFHIHHLFSFWVWVVQNGPEVQKSSGQAGIDSVLINLGYTIIEIVCKIPKLKNRLPGLYTKHCVFTSIPSELTKINTILFY